jgi:hypothetical protein
MLHSWNKWEIHASWSEYLQRERPTEQTYGFHKMVFHAQLSTIKFPTTPYTMKSDG